MYQYSAAKLEGEVEVAFAPPDSRCLCKYAKKCHLVHYESNPDGHIPFMPLGCMRICI